MGEYAKLGGEEIKIGTCENMYYLRADQAGLVTALPGNVDPMDPEQRRVIRFRFPWPDEDGIAPGGFHDRGYNRSLGLHEVAVPDDVEHSTVQFKADAGFLVSLPCPESKEAAALAKREGLTIHRNGYSGPVRIVQQKFWNGMLVTVCECGGCGARYRLETIEDAQPVIDELRKRAAHEEWQAKIQNRPPDAVVRWFGEIADRIAKGYDSAPEGWTHASL